MIEAEFTIGEVAAMLGISPHTIRAWERRYLVVHPRRTESGQRRYTVDDVELLRQIKHERHVHGLSMRVATLAAQGMIVPEVDDGPAPGGGPAAPVEAGADPLRVVADLVPEIVVVLDGGGRIAHANPAFVRFCNSVPGQVRGLPFADVVDPFDRAKAVLTYRPPLRQRRDWELNLRTRQRRALFSFACWPVTVSGNAMLVLLGREVGGRLVTQPPAGGGGEVPTGAGPRDRAGTRPGMPAQLRPLLEGVADPVRTLRLVGTWLDATPFGVALVRAGADLTVIAANRRFAAWLPADRLPVEGRTWASLQARDDAARVVAAAAEAVRDAEPRSVPGTRSRRVQQAPVWDVEVVPVTEVNGAVAHLLFVVADATAEAEAARTVRGLTAWTPAVRQARDASQLLAAAARHAQSLLANTGSLVAAVADGEREGLAVLAASGAWARTSTAGELRLRLTLVRHAIRRGASIEVQRGDGGRALETLRIVPVAPGGGRALAALAFSRPGPATFSAGERLLIDEFADRVGLALALAGPADRPGR